MNNFKKIAYNVIRFLLGNEYFIRRSKKKASKLLLKHGKEALRTFSVIIEKYNSDYWLMAGSLLGAYRNKGFIPYDDDLDLAMNNSQISVSILNALRERGFEIDMIFVTEDYAEAQIPMNYKGLIVDIYLFNPCKNREGYSYCCIYHPEDREDWVNAKANNRYSTANLELKTNKTKEISMYDLSVRVPECTRDYLVALYGEDFMTPNPRYDKEADCATFYSYIQRPGHLISVEDYLEHLRSR